MTKTLIYKFGGASVKDALSVKNTAEILRNRLRNNFVIVVSAMGKSTNTLELILSQKLESKDYLSTTQALLDFHFEVCRNLLPVDHGIFSILDKLFIQLKKELGKSISKENYDEYYDRIVGYGELASSRIVMEYLCEVGIPVLWQDARELIKTDSDFRFAKVDWQQTRKNCQTQLKFKLDKFPVLTQGFIASNEFRKPTTLGREGSDFTAAILATCLDAESVTIWKDVPGVLNADPKIFNNTILFPELDYQQAAEMTFYGASVIHPKTIRPLANASIPLFVKSFQHPNEDGTKIYKLADTSYFPTIVLKRDQILVSLKMTDFTFIEEGQIHQVYARLNKLKLRVNMLQVSAISISIVIDSQLFKLEQFLEKLKDDFEIRYNDGLELLTIIYPQENVDEFLEGYEILLEQRTRTTYQIVRRKVSRD
jgi:aspartate kinase